MIFIYFMLSILLVKEAINYHKNHTYFEGKGRHGDLVGADVVIFQYGGREL